PIEPVVSGGIISNRNEAILGGDDKAALAAMLVALRRVVDEGLPHAGIELVATVQEEVGLHGAKAFDHDRLQARTGFVFDAGGQHRELKTVLDAMTHAANVEERRLETVVTDEYQAYRLRRTDEPVALALEALGACGHEVRLIEAGGGADSHVFNARGRRCA